MRLSFSSAIYLRFPLGGSYWKTWRVAQISSFSQLCGARTQHPAMNGPPAMKDTNNMVMPRVEQVEAR